MAEAPKIGSRERPHASTDSMALARDIVASRFAEGLLDYRGCVWHWEGGRWRERDETWVLDRVREHFEDSWVQVDGADAAVVERFRPGAAKVKDVASCVGTVTRVDHYREAPFGNGKEAVRAVAFNGGRVVEVGETLVDRGEWGSAWFDPAMVDCEWKPDAACPTWMRCLEEWSGGDAAWVTLMRRLFGYCLLSTREYQRWFLFYGVPRSGKGTVLSVLRGLMGGGSAVWHTTLPQLTGSFGLDGLQAARVMVVNEVHEVGRLDGNAAGGILKGVVGGDPVNVNVKHVRQLRNVVCRAVPILQSNEIPTLPNRGAGLSSKMVVVPFSVSFLGHEDEALAGKLAEEREGVAAWAMEGAREVVTSSARERWPQPKGALEALEEYREENTPWDEFLERYFEPDPAGWVSVGVLWSRYQRWCAEDHEAPMVGQRQLVREMVRGTGWRLQRHRRADAKGVRGMRVAAL